MIHTISLEDINDFQFAVTLARSNAGPYCKSLTIKSRVISPHNKIETYIELYVHREGQKYANVVAWRSDRLKEVVEYYNNIDCSGMRPQT